jgi:hypothetical protein
MVKFFVRQLCKTSVDCRKKEFIRMKLTHIFWSLLILAIIVFIPSLLYRPNTKLGGGPDLVGFYLLLWIMTTGISPVVIILKTFNLVKSNARFLLTLLCILNFYFGCYGIYMIQAGQITQYGSFFLSLLLLNLVCGVLIILLVVKSKNGKSLNTDDNHRH